MRCVHAQVCDADNQDTITISSFVRFVNIDQNDVETKRQHEEDKNRISLRDGRTLTPRTEFDTRETSRPGQIELMVESVENVPKTSFVGRSELYVCVLEHISLFSYLRTIYALISHSLTHNNTTRILRTRTHRYVRSRLVLVSNSKNVRSGWRKTKSVSCQDSSASWPQNTKLKHVVTQDLDRSVAIVVELMDRDDLTSDDEDMCVGRGTFYVRLSALSPQGSIKMSFTLAPPSRKLSSFSSSSLENEKKKIVPTILRATLNWTESGDDDREEIRLSGRMCVRVGNASKLPSSCLLRPCWLVHRLVSSATDDYGDDAYGAAALAFRSVRDEVSVHWPESLEIKLMCQDKHTDQIVELWASGKERPILVAACKIPLEPIRRHLDESGMLSTYELEKVRLTDKRGLSSRGELCDVRVRMDTSSSSTSTHTPPQFKSLQGHVGHVTCELIRIMSESNVLSGRLVSCSVSCTGTPKRIPSMIRIGATRSERNKNDDRARVEVALLKSREKNESIRPTLTVAMYDMHRGDEDAECIACGSILLDCAIEQHEEELSVRLRDADGRVFVADFVLSFTTAEEESEDDEMPSTIRAMRSVVSPERSLSPDRFSPKSVLQRVSPEITPPPPSQKSPMSLEKNSHPGEHDDKEKENLETVLSRLFDLILDSGHTVSTLRRRFSKLEEELNLPCEGGTVPRTAFRHFLQENTSFRTSSWSSVLSEFCEIDESTGRSSAFVKYETFLRCLRRHRGRLTSSSYPV